MFNKCIDINEAHKLSSVVFGVMSSKHIGCDIERETENINSGIYEEKATTVIVQPSNRYRAKTANRNSVKEKTEAKKVMAKQILEKRQREKEIIIFVRKIRKVVIIYLGISLNQVKNGIQKKQKK